MPFERRPLRGAMGAVAAATALPPPAAAAAWAALLWPTRTVKVVTPTGPGSLNDVSARVLCERLGERLGQPFIDENTPGAGTRLANDQVARAARDGYTFLYASAPFATAESLHGRLSYDPARDFQPITLAVLAPLFLIVNAQLPVRTAAEFVAYAGSRPGRITIASPGAGTAPHLGAELFMMETGVKGRQVHVLGDTAAYAELLAGRADATFTFITRALPHIHTGRLRALAVANEERSPVRPTVPTMAESGVPGLPVQ